MITTPQQNQRSEILDSQIQELQKITDFEIREYPVEVVVDKFTNGMESDNSELFVPDYQREFVWKKKQQSRFIESILLNLPVPYIFVADVAQGDREGRLEIVDGSQRIRTLVAFMQDELRLVGLKKLTEANGFTFSQMSAPRRMRFKRKTLRMIELTEQADEEARREIFDRLNSGGTKILSMEQRRGSNDGPFLNFIDTCAKNPDLRTLCPVSQTRIDRAEYLELVLRYFAYSEKYASFSKSVDDFLTDYLKEKNKATTNEEMTQKRSEFESMLRFVKNNLPLGFRKVGGNESVPRIRFEVLAIGVTLALRENPNIAHTNISGIVESDEFKKHTRSDASNSRPKVINRLHFVRDSLLNRPIQYVDQHTATQQENEEDEA